MKPTIELLEQYKQEKAHVIGGVNERTGLEDFPTFAAWKVDYVKEYQETHVTVNVKKADKIMEAAIAEADAELEEAVNPKPAKAEKPVKKVAAKKKAAKKSTSKKVATKKVATKKVATKKVATKKAVAKKSNGKSKSAKAQTIFAKFYGRKTRGEIIGKFVAQVSLTPAGAATYYQKFKKAAG